MTNKNEKTNPMIRLNEILSKAQKVPSMEDRSNVSFRKAWCRVFEIEECNSEKGMLDVLHNLLQLRQLFTDIINKLRSIEGIDEEMYLLPIVHVSGITSNLNLLDHPWATFSIYLSVENMTSLRYIQHTFSLHPEFDETKIPDDEITNILKDLNNLYELIFKSSLPSELKADLLDLIQELKQGIHDYRIRGVVTLKESLAKSVGVLVTNSEAITNNKDTEELEALARILTRIEKAYSFAVKVQPLLSAASNLLPALLPHIK